MKGFLNKKLTGTMITKTWFSENISKIIPLLKVLQNSPHSGEINPPGKKRNKYFAGNLWQKTYRMKLAS